MKKYLVIKSIVIGLIVLAVFVAGVIVLKINFDSSIEKPEKEINTEEISLDEHVRDNTSSHLKDATTDSLNAIINMAVGTSKGSATMELASYHGKNLDYLKAINLYKRALILFENDEQKTAYIYNRIGLFYFFIGNVASSVSYQFKALNAISETDTTTIQEDIFNQIGMAYSRAKKFDDALRYYNKSLKIAEEKSDSVKIMFLMINIGSIYNSKMEHEKALEYFKNIIKDDSKFLEVSVVTLNNNLGLIYTDLNEFEKAAEHYLKAIEFSEGHSIVLSIIYGNLGKLYLKKGDYSKAFEYFNNSLEICKKINDNNVILNNYDGLIKLFIKTEELDSVSKYYDLHNSIRDTIFNKNYYDKIAELESDYKFTIKEHEIEKLNIDKQLTEEKYTRYLLSLVLLVIVLIIVSLFMFMRSKRLTTDQFIVKQNLKLVKYGDQLGESESENKYKTSALSEELKSKLEIAISNKFRKEKLYLNNSLTIADLAEMLDTNRNNISQVINERFDKNFNNLINEYRIHEAMKLLSNPENKKYTIEAISKEVGFNSISVFNTSFKKVAGVTPSVFVKTMGSL